MHKKVTTVSLLNIMSKALTPYDFAINNNRGENKNPSKLA